MSYRHAIQRPKKQDDPFSDSLLGAILEGTYKIEGLIACGGCGIVFQGVDLRSRAPVAIKLPHRRLSLHPEHRTVFLEEAKVTEHCGQFCGPRVLHIGQLGKTPYYVMELLPGKDLESLIKGRGMALRRATLIISEVLKAAYQLHSHGIIHGDLKPSNVMVQETNQGASSALRVHLIDFGLAAHWLGPRGLRTAPIGYPAGTPGYMAPEVIRGGVAGIPADLYAVACIYHATLTGQPPLLGTTGRETLANHLAEGLERYHGAFPHPSIPAPVEALLRSCLSTDIDLRPRSASAMRDMLPGVPSSGASALPLRPGGTGEATSSRRPLVATALGVALASALLAFVATRDWKLLFSTYATESRPPAFVEHPARGEAGPTSWAESSPSDEGHEFIEFRLAGDEDDSKDDLSQEPQLLSGSAAESDVILEVLTPAPGEHVGSSPVTVSLGVSESADIDAVYVDGSAIEDAIHGGSSLHVPLEIPANLIHPGTETPWTVTLRVRDALGREAEERISLIVDRRPPNVYLRPEIGSVQPDGVVLVDIEGDEPLGNVTLAGRPQPITGHRAQAQVELGRNRSPLLLEISDLYENTTRVELLYPHPWPSDIVDEISIASGTTWFGTQAGLPGGSSESHHPAFPLRFPQAFYMDASEVTVDRYARFLEHLKEFPGGHGSFCSSLEPKGKDHEPLAWAEQQSTPRVPVVGVDWWDASAFAAWAGKRLPSEYEWEYAARGFEAPWAQQYPLGRRLFLNAANTFHSGLKRLVPPGRFPEDLSPFGVFDMTGNAREWTSSIHETLDMRHLLDATNKEPRLVGTLHVTKPVDPSKHSLIVRGGSFATSAQACESSWRVIAPPSTRQMDLGFRCVRD